jgi:AcrR family transcriptional regulator
MAPNNARSFATVGSAGDAKLVRNDARRNRRRLLESARELFASGGVEVSVEEITCQAGVGMGTLYRHFATKEELIDAVLEDAFAEFLALAESARAEPDPWAGLCRFLEQALAMHARHRCLKDAVAISERGRGWVEAMRRQMWPLVELVERAKAQRTLRADFTAEDVALVLWTGDRVIERSVGFAPELWRRFPGLLLDGLRRGAATLPAPPVTRAQLTSAATQPEG